MLNETWKGGKINLNIETDKNIERIRDIEGKDIKKTVLKKCWNTEKY